MKPNLDWQESGGHFAFCSDTLSLFVCPAKGGWLLEVARYVNDAMVEQRQYLSGFPSKEAAMLAAELWCGESVAAEPELSETAAMLLAIKNQPLTVERSPDGKSATVGGPPLRIDTHEFGGRWP